MAERKVFNVAEHASPTPRARSKSASEVIDRLRRRTTRATSSRRPTGYTDLDELLSGLHRALNIVGRPAMGSASRSTRRWSIQPPVMSSRRSS